MPIDHRPADAVFERWLALSLREQHATSIPEPLPEALLKLLRDEP